MGFEPRFTSLIQNPCSSHSVEDVCISPCLVTEVEPLGSVNIYIYFNKEFITEI